MLWQVTDRLKISSDSSEGVEDMLLCEDRNYMDTDILDDCDEEGWVINVLFVIFAPLLQLVLESMWHFFGLRDTISGAF